MSSAAAATSPAPSSNSSVTPPATVLGVGVAGAGVALIGGICAALALISFGAMIQPSPGWIDALLWLLGVAAFLPLVPAIRAIATAPRRARLIRDGQIPAARVASAHGRQLAMIAMGYSLAVLIVSALVWFITTNDGAVSSTFLRWEFIKEGTWLVTKAFWVNIRVSFGAEVLVLIFGLILAVMRLLPGKAGRPLRWIATFYVDVFRAIPSIIVLYLVGFGLSLAEVPVVKDMPPIWLAIIALTLTYSGYVAEVYRAGIDSIHPSQWAAARSLGLSYPLTLRTVIIPQAVRRMIPPLLNDFIGLQKDTALIGVMGVVDAFMQSRLVSSSVFNLSPVIIVAALFVIITIPQTRFVDRMIAREKGRMTGQSA